MPNVLFKVCYNKFSQYNNGYAIKILPKMAVKLYRTTLMWNTDIDYVNLVISRDSCHSWFRCTIMTPVHQVY